MLNKKSIKSILNVRHTCIDNISKKMFILGLAVALETWYNRLIYKDIEPL